MTILLQKERLQQQRAETDPAETSRSQESADLPRSGQSRVVGSQYDTDPSRVCASAIQSESNKSEKE